MIIYAALQALLRLVPLGDRYQSFLYLLQSLRFPAGCCPAIKDMVQGGAAVKGGGKTYHCGEEKVYHRGNG